ncbi:hypothetical protein HPB50_001003 [Hyalomma asiaticum]|uniref:Uncharacterized protein n=1 Tax=Hyalomma asiaticum TaxID=266040 RepID=A0ACB7SQ66_HYAAI|nr:hypothetical protein HPB50_001003 [Hyalomma asiaticum]
MLGFEEMNVIEDNAAHRHVTRRWFARQNGSEVLSRGPHHRVVLFLFLDLLDLFELEKSATEQQPFLSVSLESCRLLILWRSLPSAAERPLGDRVHRSRRRFLGYTVDYVVASAPSSIGLLAPGSGLVCASGPIGPDVAGLGRVRNEWTKDTPRFSRILGAATAAETTLKKRSKDWRCMRLQRSRSWCSALSSDRRVLRALRASAGKFAISPEKSSLCLWWHHRISVATLPSNAEEKDAEKCPFQAMDQWIAVLLRRWRNGILPSMWKAESTKKLESSCAALTQSVELMLDVQERFATVPNGPVADRVTAKLKAVLDKNPGFYVLKQVSNVLSGTDSKIPEEVVLQCRWQPHGGQPQGVAMRPLAMRHASPCRASP